MQEERIRAFTNVADKLSEAKSAAQEVLSAWGDLGDVDASSSQLEQAIGLLGQVEGDLDEAADQW